MISTEQVALSRMRPKINEEFEDINTFIGDKDNPNSSYINPIFYITVDIRNPRFYDNIITLMNSQYYVDHYLSGSLDSNICVIRMRHPIKRQWDTFIDSKYSNIYRGVDGQLFFIQSDESIISLFRKIDPKSGRVKMDKEWQVMTKSVDYFNNHILPLTHKLSEYDIKQIMINNEYDEKINTEDETYCSTKKLVYNECIDCCI